MIKVHLNNASPVYPTGQVHLGVWLITRHSASSPQEPTHGSLHLLLMHARCSAHSLLLIHSGRQLGGEPIKSCKQEQAG